MLLGIAVAGVPCLALVAVLRRRTGAAWAWSLGLLLWSLATIGVLTLIPTDGAPGVVYADERFYNSCSFDYGGPAPEGFWIVSGGQGNRWECDDINRGQNTNDYWYIYVR